MSVAQKSRVAVAIKFCAVAPDICGHLSTELAAYQRFSAQNFDVASRFLENLFTFLLRNMYKSRNFSVFYILCCPCNLLFYIHIL